MFLESADGIGTEKYQTSELWAQCSVRIHTGNRGHKPAKRIKPAVAYSKAIMAIRKATDQVREFKELADAHGQLVEIADYFFQQLQLMKEDTQTQKSSSAPNDPQPKTRPKRPRFPRRLCKRMVPALSQSPQWWDAARRTPALCTAWSTQQTIQALGIIRMNNTVLNPSSAQPSPAAISTDVLPQVCDPSFLSASRCEELASSAATVGSSSKFCQLEFDFQPVPLSAPKINFFSALPYVTSNQ